MRGLAVRAAVLVVRCYQAMIRPLLIGSCKYHPTCSEYAVEALTEHGLLRGGLLAARRLLRCHPFGRGGIDPVPPSGQPGQDVGRNRPEIASSGAANA